MKKTLIILTILLTAVTGIYFAWNYNNKITEEEKLDPIEADLSKAEPSDEVDTSALVRLGCFDLPEEKNNQFIQLTYLSYGKYISGAGFDVLKNYFTSRVLDTNYQIKRYTYEAHLKQRYFFLVYNNLPDFVDRRERHTGYYLQTEESSGEDMEDKLRAYALYRVDRSPENIQKIYELIKPSVKESISPELYENLGIKQSIHSLLDSYEYIQTLENSGAQLDSVYIAVDSVAQNFDYEAPSAYGHSLDSDYSIYNKYLYIEKYDDIHPYAYESLWAFSFWVRRHHEKNEVVVHKILKEIHDIFETGN